MRFRATRIIWIILSASLIFTVLSTAVLYRSQFILYFKIHRMLPSDDAYYLSTTPQPLTGSGTTFAKGTLLSYFGCRFEVPWQEIALERNGSRWAEVQFKAGQTVRVLNPEEFYSPDFITRSSADSSSVWRMALKGGFPRSRFEQFEAVFSATPAQLSPFQSRPKFAKTVVLLNRKGTYLEHIPFKPDIFSFKKAGLRGFEISGISRKVEEVTLTIFDDTDKMFTVIIRGNRNLNTNLSQLEIDGLIDSFSVDSKQNPGSMQRSIEEFPSTPGSVN